MNLKIGSVVFNNPATIPLEDLPEHAPLVEKMRRRRDIWLRLTGENRVPSATELLDRLHDLQKKAGTLDGLVGALSHHFTEEDWNDVAAELMENPSLSDGEREELQALRNLLQ
jgi:hypothetical protein